MFDDSKLPPNRFVYKFNSFREEGGQFLSIEVIEEVTLERNVDVAIFHAEPSGDGGKAPFHITVAAEPSESSDSEAELEKILDLGFSQKELYEFFQELNVCSSYAVPNSQIALSGNLMSGLCKNLEWVFGGGDKVDLAFLPSHFKSQLREARKNRVFFKQFNLDEAIRFLGELQDRQTYEFIEENFHLNELNVAKCRFMMGRILDTILTDGVVGDYSSEEIKEELARLNKKHGR